MLLASQPGSAYSRGHSVGHKFCKNAGILMGYNGCNRPRRCSVLRREPVPSLPEISIVVVGMGTFASQAVVQRINYSETVRRRFGCQQSSFFLVIVVAHLAPQVQAPCQSAHCAKSIV